MKKLIYALVPLTLLWAASCSRNEAVFFDDKPSLWLSGDSKQQATTDSVIFSFSNHNPEVLTYDMHLVVNVTGYASDEDRTFDLEVVADKTNVTTADYSIGDLVVPAGSVKAIIPITIHRRMSDPEWDLANLDSPAARLTVQLLSGEDFQLGAKERKQYTFSWHDRLTKPSKWDNSARTYLGPYTVSRHRFLIDYLGITDFDTFIVPYMDPVTGRGSAPRMYGLLAKCVRLLNEYNATHPVKYKNVLANGEIVDMDFGVSLKQ